MSYDLIDRAALISEKKTIDEDFITSLNDKSVFEDKPDKSIEAADTTDLLEKARKQE